ncbi:MAG: Hsp20/alpha crystallin family protein [Anaerolineaceae bacterium]|nr:Hsp20/alpha crystallin family protein [Anaerolineaceae bacterium]
MISVKFLTNPTRTISSTAESAHFLLSGIINWRSHTRSQVWRPPTDVYETAEQIVVRVEIAGMSNDDFSVIIYQNTLVINGIRRDVCQKRAFHQIEIPFGDFSTEVELTSPVELERVEATYQDGFLQVVLPKPHKSPIHISTTD